MGVLLALLVGGLVVGTSLAAAGSDPDWLASAPKNISSSPLDLAWQPNIATTASGEMVVAWSDQRLGAESGDEPRNIYVIASDDDGRTWTTAPMTVAATAENSFAPNLIAVQERIFVVWVDGAPPSALYEAERIAPDTWERRGIPSPASLINTHSDVVYGAGHLHVVFNAGTYNVPDILYAARPLTATTWPTATVAFTHTALLGSANPRLVISPDETVLHMVWEERASSNLRSIMYMNGELSGEGVNWTTPTQLSTGGTLSFWPDIASDSQDNLYVVWGEKGTEGAYVRYAYRDAAAGSWTIQGQAIDADPVTVNELLPTDIIPRLALREESQMTRACVVWYGFREGATALAEEVLLSCSTDRGQTWSAPVNVSRTTGEDDISIAPAIAFDAQGQLHSVWQEHVGGSITRNYEIYHAYAYYTVFMPLVVKNWS